MKTFRQLLTCLFIGWSTLGWAQSSINQTPTVSPILSEEHLPFRVQIELADFILPNGIQSGAVAIHQGKWLFIAGRTNGLHGFNSDTNNFPPQAQNRVVYVVDPILKTVQFKSLTDPSSGLTPQQIDLLSVTSPQFYQSGQTLYLTGGYGVDSLTGQFSTKPFLTAIDVPGLINWVTGQTHRPAARFIRHLFHPLFQVTGGYMTQLNSGPMLLVFGQNFQGFYSPNSNGLYIQQVRRFYLVDNGDELNILPLEPEPGAPNPNYRRRDLNVVPIIKISNGRLRQGLVAFSGVFTPAGGIWTVPVEINQRGVPFMANPNDPLTFKQGMNNYYSPTLGLFSRRTADMYVLFFGGISYGFFANGQFQTDEEIPFINQVTTIKRNRVGQYSQYLMSAEYPLILSTQSNPGNPLLFGAGAYFLPAPQFPNIPNRIVSLDALDRPTLMGYIVGGIQSTLPNTTSTTDSAASPYIFKVTLIPTGQ